MSESRLLSATQPGETPPEEFIELLSKAMAAASLAQISEDDTVRAGWKTVAREHLRELLKALSHFRAE